MFKRASQLAQCGDSGVRYIRLLERELTQRRCARGENGSRLVVKPRVERAVELSQPR